MTYPEGFKQAMRELGHTEKDIEERVKVCNALLPMPADGVQIPRGHEREFIDFVKAMSKQAIAEMDKDKDAYLKKVDRMLGKKNRTN